MSNYLVAALYKFVALDDFEEKQAPLQAFTKERGIKGTLLLASEGINGTVAGTEQAIRELLDYLKSDVRLKDLVHKESWAGRRCQVR